MLHGLQMNIFVETHTQKNGFFLRIFWGPICYKNSKTPKMLIYAYLTILLSMSSSRTPAYWLGGMILKWQFWAFPSSQFRHLLIHIKIRLDKIQSFSSTFSI